MIKFNKKILFLFFAASLFLFAIRTNSIIDSSFNSGKELYYQIITALAPLCTSIVFGMKLYSKAKNKSTP
jgi:hypothetical protein